MIKISPSILSADFARLGADIDTVSSADMLHFDVMDGIFVPNISIGLPVLKSVRAYTDMQLDVHLMIDRPGRYVDDFIKNGADWLTFHVEAEAAENIAPAIDKLHAAGRKAGLVIKPRTPAEAVLPWLDTLDMVLIMTVEPGFGGQGFIYEMLPKIETMRRYIDERGLTTLLEVDGGVNPDTAKLCRDAGANVLVAGSDVFKQTDRAARISQLRG